MSMPGMEDKKPDYDSAMMTGSALEISHPDWKNKLSLPYDESEPLLCNCGAKCGQR